MRRDVEFEIKVPAENCFESRAFAVCKIRELPRTNYHAGLDKIPDLTV